MARVSGFPRGLVQQAVRDGRVTVEGQVEKASYRVGAGQRVVAELHGRSIPIPRPENIPVAVRYEDRVLAVVSKPAGMIVHSGAGVTAGTLVNALMGLGVGLAGGEPERPGIVHRLDKDTSGLLVVTKDQDVHRRLSAAMKQRLVTRRYLALVRGEVASATGSIDAPIGRHPSKRRLMAVVAGGRPAVTHYDVVAKRPGMTLLDVRLETGRTHQIRVHLAHLGHPVLGDRTYGGMGDLARRLGLKRPFLHAFRLVFPHPVSSDELEVGDHLPPDLVAAAAEAGLVAEAAAVAGPSPVPH